MKIILKSIILKCCNRETISYLICGGLTTLLGIVVFWLSERAGSHVALSNTISTGVAITFAYIVNKVIVFRSASWSKGVMVKEVFTFLAGRFATYVMETLLLVLLVNIIGLPGFVCKLFTSLLVVIGNYVISKKAVFNVSSTKV